VDYTYERVVIGCVWYSFAINSFVLFAIWQICIQILKLFFRVGMVFNSFGCGIIYFAFVWVLDIFAE